MYFQVLNIRCLYQSLPPSQLLGVRLLHGRHLENELCGKSSKPDCQDSVYLYGKYCAALKATESFEHCAALKATESSESNL